MDLWPRRRYSTNPPTYIYLINLNNLQRPHVRRNVDTYRSLRFPFLQSDILSRKKQQVNVDNRPNYVQTEIVPRVNP
jgi:hypothetical protein